MPLVMVRRHVGFGAETIPVCDCEDQTAGNRDGAAAARGAAADSRASASVLIDAADSLDRAAFNLDCAARAAAAASDAGSSATDGIDVSASDLDEVSRRFLGVSAADILLRYAQNEPELAEGYAGAGTIAGRGRVVRGCEITMPTTAYRGTIACVANRTQGGHRYGRQHR